MTDPSIPNNHGCYRPIRVRVPDGCLLNPRAGAPVAIRAHTLKRAADTVLGALRGAGENPVLIGEIVPPGGARSEAKGKGEAWAVAYAGSLRHAG